MRIRGPFVFFLLLGVALTATWATSWGQQAGVGMAERRADGVGEKRAEMPRFGLEENEALQNKRFPIKEWSKHYSPLGNKRAPISTDESKKRKMFRDISRRSARENAENMKMSRWNERMADLQERAGISTDERVREITDERMYEMMLQEDPRKFKDLAENVSLRDINRYQFRRNRTDEGIPERRAGGGDGG